MGKQGRPIRLKDFTGGEASIFPFSNMPPKYSVKLQNCHISANGGIAKMPGYVKVNTTQVAETLKSGFEFRKSDGTVIILCGGGGKIYKVGAGNNLEAIKTGLNASAKISFAAMNNICIMVNGVDAPMKYDGTTVANLGGTPPATAFMVHVHQGRVWLLERTNKLLATHSAFNNPEDYTTAANAGYIDFKFVLKRGDELLDIATYADLQIFFFRDHIAIYSGSNPTSSGDYALVQLIEGVGVVGTGCYQPHGIDNAVFLYKGGAKSIKQVVTTGAVSKGDVSEAINPTLVNELASLFVLSSAQYSKENWLLFLINSTIWVYSQIWKAWARLVGADVGGMFNTVDGKLYLCGAGFLYEYGSGWTFAGTEPQMVWETAWVPLSKRGDNVFPKFAKIITEPQAGTQTQIDVEVRYDQNLAASENVSSFNTEPGNLTYIDTITDWDAIESFDEILYEEVRLPLFGGGRTMQFIFSNKSDKAIRFMDVVLQATMGGLL